MTIATPAHAKVARSRERMRKAGLRPVQFWVPDTRSESFVQELRAQCEVLRGDPQETELLALTEAAAAQTLGWR